jgi:hypothetical protein
MNVLGWMIESCGIFMNDMKDVPSYGELGRDKETSISGGSESAADSAGDWDAPADVAEDFDA